jgi:Putative porin
MMKAKLVSGSSDRGRLALRLASLLAMSFTTPAMLSETASAQENAQNAVEQSATPSANATVNLIRALVRKGVLSQAEADAMIGQAEAEANEARGDSHNPTASAEQALPPGAVRVPYIPALVRDQIREELKAEVLSTARSEGWATPNETPEWTKRIEVFGDLKFRYEGRYYGDANFGDAARSSGNVGPIDFNRVNAGSPVNIGANNSSGFPILNSTEDRGDLLRLRARIGFRANLSDTLVATVRLASGADTSAVSTNQTLGGGFSKKDVFLDQAYFTYTADDGSILNGLSVTGGRMPNPFVTSEIVWDDDVALDGLAARYGADFKSAGLQLFGTAGAFPLDYASDSAPTPSFFSSDKASSNKDKWLWAAQLGAEWDPGKLDVRLSAAFYDYSGVEGLFSTPCLSDASFCSTDQRRAFGVQKGNTLFALRDTVAFPSTDQTNRQYFGLASKFRVAEVDFGASYAFSPKLAVRVDGAYAVNTAYDRAEILARATNPVTGDSFITNADRIVNGQNVFESGANAYMGRIGVGAPKIEQFGDWNASVAYRYIEPDAVLDAFVDSDFRLGGTNSEGFVLTGTLGLQSRANLQVRWLSANEIYGVPFSVDVAQVDLNLKF